MKITVKLYAALQDYLPAHARATNALALDVPAGTTVQDVITQLALPPRACHLVLLDGRYVPPAARATQRLSAGATLALWPPIAGG